MTQPVGIAAGVVTAQVATPTPEISVDKPTPVERFYRRSLAVLRHQGRRCGFVVVKASFTSIERDRDIFSYECVLLLQFQTVRLF